MFIKHLLSALKKSVHNSVLIPKKLTVLSEVVGVRVGGDPGHAGSRVMVTPTCTYKCSRTFEAVGEM